LAVIMISCQGIALEASSFLLDGLVINLSNRQREPSMVYDLNVDASPPSFRDRPTKALVFIYVLPPKYVYAFSKNCLCLEREPCMMYDLDVDASPPILRNTPITTYVFVYVCSQNLYPGGRGRHGADNVREHGAFGCHGRQAGGPPPSPPHPTPPLLSKTPVLHDSLLAGSIAGASWVDKVE